MQIKENHPQHKRVNAVLRSMDWSPLEPFNPKLVGTFPIDIDVEGSDLDIICTFEDPEAFMKAIDHYSSQKGFDLVDGAIILCRFEVDGIPFEIYGSYEDTLNQNGYRHMLVEAACLKHFGDAFRHEIRTLKALGLKTEPAFALLLNLFGDPYKRLLDDDWIYPKNWHNPLKDLEIQIFKIRHLDKGWSHDLKLVAETDQGRVLIRMSPLETHDKKWAEYQQISRLKSSKVTLPQCIEYKCSDRVMTVYRWVEGEDLAVLLSDMPIDRQYALGMAAGQGLRDIQVPADSYDWSKNYDAKIHRVIDSFRNCGIDMPGSEQVISFIMTNKKLLENRPIVFQHGDYHIGNMVLSQDHKLGIVDFNRSSTGDPWEEYDRFVFTWRISPVFAYGQLKGYFKEIPEDFFRLMALYNGLNALSAIPWAIPFGHDDVVVMKANYMTIMAHYEGFTTYLPKWYRDVEGDLTWISEAKE